MGSDLGNIGNDYLALGDYTSALDYILRALKIEEEIDNKRAIPFCLTALATIYEDIGDNARSLECNLKALKEFDELNDRMDAGMVLYNIGEYYDRQNQFDKASGYAGKGAKIFEEQGYKAGMAMCDLVLSHCYRETGHPELALELAQKGLALSKEAGDKNYQAGACKAVAATYIVIAKDSAHHGRTISDRNAAIANAMNYLQQGKALAIEANALGTLEEIYKNISEVSSLSGDYKAALDNFREYTKLKDSIFSNDNNVKIAKLETKRETDLKEKQVALNALRQRQQKTERNIYLGGIFALVLVSGLVTRNVVKQRKTNRLLHTETTKSAALLVTKDELLGQKDMLMKEIHHRVKNNLQVIGALLDLQLDNISDETARKALTEGMGRIRSIALIHQQLYNEADLASLEFSRFAKDLLKQVISVFKKPGQHISREGELPETLLDIDTAVPLGLVLNELMTNSFKYAFSDGRDGSISLILADKGEMFELRYNDSGPGLPAGYDIGKGGTLGLMVIASLAQQLGGHFTYDSMSKQFIITFKGREERKKIA